MQKLLIIALVILMIMESALAVHLNPMWEQNKRRFLGSTEIMEVVEDSSGFHINPVPRSIIVTRPVQPMMKTLPQDQAQRVLLLRQQFQSAGKPIYQKPNTLFTERVRPGIWRRLPGRI
ncbi:hypothetical protein HYS48_02395 [Candidatus Woesearchaeota archaeon]|nr:hypothetical protein [Candidatus Woesearchaeota archaeon]